MKEDFKKGNKCPKCESSLFHVIQEGQKLTIRCWKKDCEFNVILDYKQ